MDKSRIKQVERFLPLGFPNYHSLKMSVTCEVFASEIVSVRNELPGLEKFIDCFAPFAVKIRRTIAFTKAISSAAYPECPDFIFYTELIRHHLPPDSVWNPRDSKLCYPVIENLIHEAIHHWWADGLSALPEEVRKSLLEVELQVSWREEKWSLDKALHAAWVYLAASELRTMLAPKYQVAAQQAAAELFSAEAVRVWCQVFLSEEMNWTIKHSLNCPSAAKFLRFLEIL